MGHLNSQGLFEGKAKGICRYENGDYFDGTWSNGFINTGTGTISSKIGKYEHEGSFKDGKFHGEGFMMYTNRNIFNIFNGEWEN